KPAAVVAATLYMFNGFFVARMLIGHASFQGVMLIPWIATLLTGKRPLSIDPASWFMPILAGLLIAYWLQSGMAVVMIASGRAVLALAVLCCATGHARLVDLLAKTVVAVTVALALSASKLAANAAVLRQFPRTEYQLPGFDSLLSMANALFHSFF